MNETNRHKKKTSLVLNLLLLCYAHGGSKNQLLLLCRRESIGAHPEDSQIAVGSYQFSTPKGVDNNKSI